MQSDTFDITIAGAGAAGLTLADKILNSSLSDKKILIIDKNDKNINDRTWCFWTNEKTGFEPILSKKWQTVIFKNKDEERLLNLCPYEYQMIRGIDFYQFVKEKIARYSNVIWVKEQINVIEEKQGLVIIKTDHNSYLSSLVFNSLPLAKPDAISRRNNYLLQHFKGYVITTESDSFNPDTPCLMDFSVEQNHQTRFGYVLPFSKKKALVEFTLFSEELLPKNEYNLLLKGYIRDHLEIEQYTVEEEEFGIIPMTDKTYEQKEGKNIYNIGTRGGMTKASTGYTFKNIVDECISIVKKMEKGNLSHSSKSKKFSFFDSVLLHVLAKNLHPSDKIFSNLFLKNDPVAVLKFLDEKTTITEDLKILSSLPSLPFLKATWYYLFSTGKKKISFEPE